MTEDKPIYPLYYCQSRWSPVHINLVNMDYFEFQRKFEAVLDESDDEEVDADDGIRK